MILKRSETHSHVLKLLNKHSTDKIKENIFFRTLEQSDLDEIRLQHAEWFPLNYPDDFYEKILHKQNVIAIGCFLDLDGLNSLDLIEKL